MKWIWISFNKSMSNPITGWDALIWIITWSILNALIN